MLVGNFSFDILDYAALIWQLNLVILWEVLLQNYIETFFFLFDINFSFIMAVLIGKFQSGKIFQKHYIVFFCSLL